MNATDDFPLNNLREEGVNERLQGITSKPDFPDYFHVWTV